MKLSEQEALIVELLAGLAEEIAYAGIRGRGNLAHAIFTGMMTARDLGRDPKAVDVAKWRALVDDMKIQRLTPAPIAPGKWPGIH